MPLRIAVYFSGHLRNLSDNWPNYKRIFTDTDFVEFDFYFTLWRKNHIADSPSWVHNNKTGKILMKTCDITEEDVRMICPEAKHIHILTDYQVPESHAEYPINTVSQFYILNKSFNDVPKLYNYYVRMRCDIYFFKTIDWPQVFRRDYDLIMPESVHFTDKNWPNGYYFNDYFWISDEKTGEYISNIYQGMLKENTNEMAERYLSIHLTNKPGIIISHESFEIALERRTRGFDDQLDETRVYTDRRIKEGNLY